MKFEEDCLKAKVMLASIMHKFITEGATSNKEVRSAHLPTAGNSPKSFEM
jgi:hypothetical protein